MCPHALFLHAGHIFTLITMHLPFLIVHYCVMKFININLYLSVLILNSDIMHLISDVYASVVKL